MEPHPGRLRLETIASSLTTVERYWTEIDNELERRGIGRKDPFDAAVQMHMLSAFGYLDELLDVLGAAPRESLLPALGKPSFPDSPT